MAVNICQAQTLSVYLILTQSWEEGVFIINILPFGKLRLRKGSNMPQVI